jgi:RNA polymerase sigma factor (sigma-70 family)
MKSHRAIRHPAPELAEIFPDSRAPGFPVRPALSQREAGAGPFHVVRVPEGNDPGKIIVCPRGVPDVMSGKIMTAAAPPPTISPASPPDAALLHGWARRRDEDAFRVLAARHVPSVLATARRCTGHDALAEEAAQRVLTILARKAAFLEHAPLAPWLHRTTVLECRSLLRRESRHRRRALAVAAEPVSAPQDHQDSAWQEALPVLDEVIDRLGEADRRVVVLRFFEDLSFREIAGRVGKSEAAVQRQGHRALERLGVLLRRRGVVLSGTALAAGLAAMNTAGTGKAAAGVIANVLAGTGPQPGAAALLLNTLHTMSQTKTALTAAGAVLLLAAIPLGLQWRENSRLSRELDDAAARLTAMERRLLALAGQKPSAAATTTSVRPRTVAEAGTVQKTSPPDDAAPSAADFLMGAGEKEVATRMTARLKLLRERLQLRPDQEPALQKASEACNAAVLAAFERIRQNKATPPDMGILSDWSLGTMPLSIEPLLDAGQAAAFRELENGDRTGRVEGMTNMELVEMQSQGALQLTPEQKDAAFATLSAIITEEDAAGPAYYADDGQFTARVQASIQRRREAMQPVLDAAQQAEYSRMLDEDFAQVLKLFPPAR